MLIFKFLGKTEIAALKCFTENKNKKEAIAIDIKYCERLVSELLSKNITTLLSKTIFSVGSSTFDIQQWDHWNYKIYICIDVQVLLVD